jgi:simple sugar transport system permease protein
LPCEFIKVRLCNVTTKEYKVAKKVLASDPPQEIQIADQPRSNIGAAIGRFFLRRREASIFLVAVVLIIYFQFSNSAFLSLDNVKTIAEFGAATTIIAAGEVMLLICGEIDLSVGYVFAIAPFIMYFANNAGLSIPLSIVIALLASAGIGFVNGFVTVFLKVPSFITTLGTLYLLDGLTLTISGGYPVLIPQIDAGLNAVLGNNIYWESFWALLIVIVMQVVLSGTRWGLHTISTGSNMLGASEVGINVNRIKLINFMLVSIFGAISGILEAFRVTSIDPTAGGNDIMFSAVAGAVIGGTALQGGSGTIVGALLGTLVLSILKDGLTLIGVSAFTFDIILGVAIIFAMILNIRLQILRKAGKQ